MNEWWDQADQCNVRNHYTRLYNNNNNLLWYNLTNNCDKLELEARCLFKNKTIIWNNILKYVKTRRTLRRPRKISHRIDTYPISIGPAVGMLFRFFHIRMKVRVWLTGGRLGAKGLVTQSLLALLLDYKILTRTTKSWASSTLNIAHRVLVVGREGVFRQNHSLCGRTVHYVRPGGVYLIRHTHTWTVLSFTRKHTVRSDYFQINHKSQKNKWLFYHSTLKSAIVFHFIDS